MIFFSIVKNFQNRLSNRSSPRISKSANYFAFRDIIKKISDFFSQIKLKNN